MVPPLKVLLVEDNDSFRKALQMLFELEPDIEVVGALAEGGRAAEACRALGPDVVMLDYRLPGLDGVEIARSLRGECPGVAVVCLTGAASERELEELRDVGVAATLTKDARLDAIVAALQKAAGREAA